jgi:metal-responsive CopG/Arc/MetJ family transcriptional regulator
MSPAGRPEVGKPVNVRLGDELLAQVDAYAEIESIKRAEAIRQLVQRGLRRAKR